MLIQLNKLSLYYGTQTILDQATVTFSYHQKIGVIGRNGAGKSSLCKLIVGEEEASSGSVSFGSNLRLSYLEQKDPYQPGECVLDFLTRYSGKPEWECGKLSARFGLGPEYLHQVITSLAGGYQMRVKLTAMLLKDPNFLILDEPTNYLDLATLLLLERFLLRFKGSFIIVSHDREFLKKTCDHTVEIEHGNVLLYKGNVEDYLGYKQAILEQKQQLNESIERQKKHLQAFVNRFGAKASLAASAQSKRKQMERLHAIHIDHTLRSVTIRMPTIPAKNGVAFDTDMLAVGYSGKKVASRINLHVKRGDHVAILGDNGQGKSTFIKTLAGELPPLAGEFQWSQGMKLGYYAQHVYQRLGEKQTVFDCLESMAERGTPRQSVLDMAGCFLFGGDDVKKKVAVLSGGERARLYLAGLLLGKKDVLLLDEPSNHLDFETVEALGEALKDYLGTVLFISHDRTFVNTLATSIIEVKNGRVELYPGTYEEYVYHLESEMDAQDR